MCDNVKNFVTPEKKTLTLEKMKEYDYFFCRHAYTSGNGGGPIETGVVVDLGERMDVVPIVDGLRVSAGVSRSAVGGFELRSKLSHYLQVNEMHSF